MDNQAASDAFVAWMRDKRGASPHTLDKYRRNTTAWGMFLPTPLAERTPEDVEAFTARSRRTEGASAATVANEVAVLGSFYRWGQARLDWPTNPAALAGRPKVHNRQPRPVDDDTWLRVWQTDLPTDARVALGLGYFCGLRRAEITALRGEQVWGRSLVNFTRKGGGEDRFDYGDVVDHFKTFLPQLEPDRLEAPLRQLAMSRGGLALMPWASWSSPRTLNKRMSRWLSNCGVQSDSFTPHSLRHSFATNLMRTGVPLDVACDLCNHSSPAITMRYIRTAGGRLSALRQTGVALAEAR